MKFRSTKTIEFNEGRLIYDKEEYSFDFEPNLSADFSLLIACVNVTFDSVTKAARQVWGYEPYVSWKKRKLNPPITQKLGLVVENEIESGDGYRIRGPMEWPSSYFDEYNGWICMGDYNVSDNESAVEFAQDTVIVLSNGEIKSLWLRPEFV